MKNSSTKLHAEQTKRGRTGVQPAFTAQAFHQRHAVTFDAHACRAESAFWNGHLKTTHRGLRSLTEKILSLSGNNVQGVERIKFLCDLKTLSFDTSA
ncbi:MAG: hypothetical protein HQL90_10285 [Magnetococcales bacterium]|nr:hypothetical protein [Magnetococcales bacterium]